MKTEHFDDAVRNKLESIHHPYTEDDINKVHSHVSTHLRRTRLIKIYKVAGISSAVLAVAGLLTWNVFQTQENDKLARQVEQLQQDLRRTENPQTLIQKDTIYIHQTEAEQANPNEQTNLASRPVEAIENNNSATPETIQKKHIQEQVNSQELYTSQNSKQVKEPVPQEEKTNAEVDLPQEVVKENKEQTIVAILATDSAGDIVSVPDQKEDKKYRKDLFKKNPVWKYQAGIGFEVADDQLGYGFYGEAIHKNRWGFGAGVKVLHISREHFNDPKDFHDRKGHSFNEVYKEQMPDSMAPVENIGISNTVFQIPLAVTYYIPLKKQFSIMLSAGTDIEISEHQYIDYFRRDISPTRPEHTSGFTTTTKTIALNNAVFAAGLQKQWKHFKLQASPFITPQLTPVEYKHHSMATGLRIRAMYSFGG